jgi:hypothetical protein
MANPSLICDWSVGAGHSALFPVHKFGVEKVPDGVVDDWVEGISAYGFEKSHFTTSSNWLRFNSRRPA